MTQLTQAISPLRWRMIDNMRMRKLSPKTTLVFARSQAVCWRRRVTGASAVGFATENWVVT